MKKVVRLTESELSGIIKRIIKEDKSEWWREYGFDSEDSFLTNYEKIDDYALDLIDDVDEEIRKLLFNFFENIDLGSIIEQRKDEFKERYPQYSNPGEFYNENIDNLITANIHPDSEQLINRLEKGYDFLMDYLFYSR